MSSVEDYIAEKLFAKMSEIKRDFQAKMATSTLYYQLNTLVKNRVICEVKVRKLWKTFLLGFPPGLEGREVGEVEEDVYLWSFANIFSGRFFNELENIMRNHGVGRFDIKLKNSYENSHEKVIAVISSRQFSENCRAKVKIISPPYSPTGELWLFWRSSQNREININPGEEQEVDLFEIKPSKDSGEWYREELKYVKKQLEKLRFTPPEERDQGLYEHFLWREEEYHRRLMHEHFPYLTSLVEHDRFNEEALMWSIYYSMHFSPTFSGIALFALSIYCKDAFDKKPYLIHRNVGDNFLSYALYEITEFVIRGARGKPIETLSLR